jgi:hypothetical protein
MVDESTNTSGAQAKKGLGAETLDLKSVEGRRFLRQRFVNVGWDTDNEIENVLTTAPPVVLNSWNDYMSLSPMPLGGNRTAELLLELACCFVRFADPTKVSDELLTRFKEVAANLDVWPGFISDRGWITKTERRKIEGRYLRLSRKHVLRDWPPVWPKTAGRVPSTPFSLLNFLSEAPPIIRETWEVYWQLAHCTEMNGGYVHHVLALACRFVDAVDPGKVPPPLLKQLRTIAIDRDYWPGYLVTREELRLSERLKVLTLQLGRRPRPKKVKTRNKKQALSVAVVVAERLLKRLQTIASLRDKGDQCAEDCKVGESRAIIPCRSRDCPWRGKKQNQLRMMPGRPLYWEFHYIVRRKPPLDIAHARYWIDVAGVLLDSESGTASIRRAAQIRHFRAMRANPGVILEVLDEHENRRSVYQNELRATDRFPRLMSAIVEGRYMWQREHSSGPVPSAAGCGYETAWPCALSDPKINEYATRVQKYVKDDGARYRQFRKDVMARLAERLPQP